ncbi:hypothetical protein ONZ45_g2035 [Pleurotus djamor]|nr:hypothetical protein ONZ45_g2035 [Pleurotus djamor]
MNPIRMQFIQEKVREMQWEDGVQTQNRVLEGLKVLDIGCGGGLLSESLARSGAHTLGIDASESNIAIASVHAQADPQLSSPSSPLKYRQISAESLLAESGAGQYDVVCSMEVLEHVDNPSDFLHSCAQLVKASIRVHALTTYYY